AQHRGDELVEHLRDRLEPAGNQTAARSRQKQEGSRQHHAEDHEGRGIGEGEVQPADVDLNPLDEMELVDRIDLVWLHVLPLRCPRPLQRRRHSSLSFLGSREPISWTSPADRNTLNTPAAKPRRRKTINPHGPVPASSSSTQPMSAPPRTPAMNSLDSRSATLMPASPLVLVASPASLRSGLFAASARSRSLRRRSSSSG